MIDDIKGFIEMTHEIWYKSSNKTKGFIVWITILFCISIMCVGFVLANKRMNVLDDRVNDRERNTTVNFGLVLGKIDEVKEDLAEIKGAMGINNRKRGRLRINELR